MITVSFRPSFIKADIQYQSVKMTVKTKVISLKQKQLMWEESVTTCSDWYSARRCDYSLIMKDRLVINFIHNIIIEP